VKSMPDIVVEICKIAGQAALERAVSDLTYELNQHIEVLESPLEMIMLTAIVAEGIKRDIFVAVTQPTLDREEREKVQFSKLSSPRSCNLAAQFPIGEHRADFCMCFYRDVRIVVECDGHDYHERTKEQAIRDKSRDRAFQAAGFQVFRFTGREIWRDALKCASEVFDAARMEMDRRIDRESGE